MKSQRSCLHKGDCQCKPVLHYTEKMLCLTGLHQLLPFASKHSAECDINLTPGTTRQQSESFERSSRRFWLCWCNFPARSCHLRQLCVLGSRWDSCISLQLNVRQEPRCSPGSGEGPWWPAGGAAVMLYCSIHARSPNAILLAPSSGVMGAVCTPIQPVLGASTVRQLTSHNAELS